MPGQENNVTILGLLQNQWAYNPKRVREGLDRATPENRHKLIRYMLAGSRSGRRLKEALGTWFDEIVWDNASPVITSRPSGTPPGDAEHVRNVIARVQPEIILAFGRIAYDTVLAAGWKRTLIRGPHPAARNLNASHPASGIRGLTVIRNELTRKIKKFRRKE